ncbi:MAG TPA: hypothetical protein ENJ52_08320 [Aliiroseovarius sp.]|nr:hypothetical protein [Aliiroseovarius sp.]
MAHDAIDIFTLNGDGVRVAVYPTTVEEKLWRAMVNSKLVGEYETAADAMMAAWTSQELAEYKGCFSINDWFKTSIERRHYPEWGADMWGS